MAVCPGLGYIEQYLTPFERCMAKGIASIKGITKPTPTLDARIRISLGMKTESTDFYSDNIHAKVEALVTKCRDISEISEV